MCIAVVGQVTAVDAHGAIVRDAGGDRHVSLAPLTLTGTDVPVGTWVLVHTGFAVAVLDAQDAARLREDLDAARPAGGAR